MATERTEVCPICNKDKTIVSYPYDKNETMDYVKHLCHESHIQGDMFVALNFDFPVFLSPDVGGMMNTLAMLKKLTPAQWSTLASTYGIKVGENTSSFDVKNLIAGFVQNEWYMAAKGEIPMSTQKNQEARATAAAKPKKGDGEGAVKEAGERKQRELKKYRVATGKSEEIGKLKGQAQQVVTALKSLGTADVKAVGAELLKNPEFKTRQSPERVAGYYFKMLSDDGLLVAVE